MEFIGVFRDYGVLGLHIVEDKGSESRNSNTAINIDDSFSNYYQRREQIVMVPRMRMPLEEGKNYTDSDKCFLPMSRSTSL